MPQNTVKNHRSFNAHRFINKFARGGEPILQRFLAHHLPDSDLAKSEKVTVDAFLSLFG
ncbi:MAG TPA: hypothetical protein VGA56_11800 [Opitutaceae bacterium]